MPSSATCSACGACSTRGPRSPRVSAPPYEAGRVSDGERGSLHVHDLDRLGLIYVCMLDRPRDELVVVTLWEQGDDPAVPREFTDALRRLDRRRQ